ncbi:MAG TPA: TIGR00269 family protein [Nitrososphaerales archaeon]|nr:TIGR00269 family protein [Nitrososphaerales archaeon]
MAVCSKCGGNGVYERRYSGEVLCANCFKASIVEKTRRTISRYGMVKFGDRIGVAVSGGKDSLSLLKVLDGLNQDSRFQLVALTVDEGVRGYREESIAHASDLTRQLNIEHVVVSYEGLFGFSLDKALDWRDEREISSCSICGVFRRRAIDEAALKAKVDVVATAHNLDDYAQTFLMNLLHGDVERIGWLDPAYVDEGFPVRRVKPFMEIYEEEVALYAYLSGIPFQSVSCPYMHEGLRGEVRDYLNEMEVKHPGMKNVLLKSSLSVVSRLSPAEGGRHSVPCITCGKPSSGGICNVCKMKEVVRQHVKYGE